MTRADVAADWDFADRYLDHMRELAGLVVVGIAPLADDIEHAADLVVITRAGRTFACRARRPAYQRSFGHEFTIRKARPTGADTELAKVLAGWGDFLIYGFADRDPDSTRLAAWVIGDLDIFRAWYAAAARYGPEPGKRILNPDDGTEGRAFAIDDLPPAFVIERRRAPAAPPAPTLTPEQHRTILERRGVAPALTVPGPLELGGRHHPATPADCYRRSEHREQWRAELARFGHAHRWVCPVCHPQPPAA